jgi:PKD repeat protein
MKKILLILFLTPCFLWSQNEPTASFIYNPVCLGEIFTPSDFSTPNPITNSSISTWEWRYDGIIYSTQQNGEYTFSQCGTYDITLTVTDVDGISDDTTINIEIFCPPVADFFFDIVCIGDPTNFVDVSTPGDGTPPLNNGSWFYIFGDANPPNAVNPNCTATFNYAGLNPVTFIVSEEYNGQVCIDTITKDVQVDSAVSPPCPPPVGIENNTNNISLKIIGTFDILGKKKKANSKDLNIIRYENGLVEKKYIIK